MDPQRTSPDTIRALVTELNNLKDRADRAGAKGERHNLAVKVIKLVQNMVDVREALTDRLHAGWDRIEEKKAAGEEYGHLEDYWIDLLNAYEQVCQALDEENYGNELSTEA